MVKAQRETGLFLLTTDSIQGYEVVEYYGLVKGASVMGANVFKDFMARLSDRVGGKARGYTRSLDIAIDNALLDMARDAKKLGANAILSVRINTSDMNRTMLQASCFGTALKIRPING